MNRCIFIYLSNVQKVVPFYWFGSTVGLPMMDGC